MTIQTHQLDNGLRLQLYHRADLPLVAVNVWYHVGSKNERPRRTGLAHLFEHMLFQGSQHVGANDHFRYVQQVGGVANGSTWYDRTNYYETLPANHLELGLWLESDRMGFLLPAMTSEKLENQRSVVMNERRQRVDNQPYGRAFERLHELLYPEGHPYRWPVIGYMEDIEAASLEDVVEFFETYYRPNNAVLTLAGDFDQPAAIGAVERYFGDLAAAADPPLPSVGLPPPMEAVAEETLPDQVKLARVYLAWTVPSYGSGEWYAVSLLSSILTGGKAGRLYRDLVYERQIAQNVFATVFPTEACATFCVVATAKPDVDPTELRAQLLRALDEIASEGVTEEERQRALNGILTAHYSELQSLDQLADNISGAATLFDDPERAFSEPARYNAISGDRIRDCVSSLLPREAFACVTVVPDESTNRKVEG